MKKSSLSVMLFAGVVIAASAIAAEDQTDVKNRLEQSAQVLNQMLGSTNGGIPEGFLNHAQCVVVIPGMKKGAFLVGGTYGAGFASCRTGSTWSAPAGVQIKGGSFGAQLGVQKTDLVALFMDEKAHDQILQNSLTLGANASVQAGPTGASASTDTADILVYTRTNGVMASLAVNGAKLQADGDANRALYGATVSTRAILTGKQATPGAATDFLSALSGTH